MWLIYGANGFTGRLIAQEAARRGHKPVLAGRSAEQVRALADSLGLEARVFGLDDLDVIVRNIEDCELVLHCAGPYVLTAGPMLRACMLSGAHYLDLTGEITVYESNYAYDEAARQQGRAVISGVGFDVIPSDCLACMLSSQISNPTRLELAFSIDTRSSVGTASSVVENGGNGFWVRREGKLTPLPMGVGARTVHFPNGDQRVMPIPWGDLSTAWRSTGIPNITTYMAMPPYVPPLLRVLGPPGQVAMTLKPVRDVLKALIGLTFRGPSAAMQTNNKAYVWAQVSNEAGESAQAVLETPEPYYFTAVAAVAAVDKVLADNPAGVLSPAQALGADFVLGIEGVRLLDERTP